MGRSEASAMQVHDLRRVGGGMCGGGALRRSPHPDRNSPTDGLPFKGRSRGTRASGRRARITRAYVLNGSGVRSWVRLSRRNPPFKSGSPARKAEPKHCTTLDWRRRWF